jgi:hypothetical protein
MMKGLDLLAGDEPVASEALSVNRTAAGLNKLANHPFGVWLCT